jgi:type IV pilus assembly protein PilE
MTNVRRIAAFSLVELMLVVVVIALLATIAISSYSRYGFRARRADGQELLLRVANAQERYYATYYKYGSDPVTGDLKLSSIHSEKGYYTVAITAADLTRDYTATVTPVGGQAADACGALSINSVGVKTPLPTDSAKNGNGHCW